MFEVPCRDERIAVTTILLPSAECPNVLNLEIDFRSRLQGGRRTRPACGDDVVAGCC